ncbi:MAG: hypothetical protein AB7S38_30780 [Vulcanimicrobiota bacterium]
MSEEHFKLSPFSAVADALARLLEDELEPERFLSIVNREERLIRRWLSELRRLKLPADYPDGEVISAAGIQGCQEMLDGLAQVRRALEEGDDEALEAGYDRVSEGHELIEKLLATIATIKERNQAQLLEDNFWA